METIITIVVLFGLWHDSHKVRRPSNGLALILHQQFMHAHLIRLEESSTTGWIHIKVHVNGTGWTNNLGRNGLLVKVLVQHIQLKVDLEQMDKIFEY